MEKPDPGRGQRRTLPAFARWWPAALAAWGLTLALLVGADGSPGWQVLRVAVVLAVTAAAAWLWARTRLPGGAAAVVCGTVGVAVGIAIGIRYLAVDGASWRAMAGLLQLATGLVLLIMGAVRTLSRVGRPWWKIAAGLALALAVVLVLWNMTPALVATNVPPIAAGEASPADFGLASRDVRFTAEDGTGLFAWYVPSVNGAALVLRHGSGSTGSDALPQAEVLARHGYGVLVTDARGHGRSGGRAMDFGWYGDSDIRAAVSFLEAQPEVDAGRIGVVGLSMGGEEALGAAAGDPRVAAVVAEGATARTDADKSWLPDVYGTRGAFQLGLEWVEYSLADLLTGASKPVALADAALAAAPRPVLLIVAGEVSDEGHAADHIRQKAPDNVAIWVVEGAGHTGGLSAAPIDWETTVIGFLDAALARP